MAIADMFRRESKPKAFCLWKFTRDGWKVVAGPAPAADVIVATSALALAVTKGRDGEYLQIAEAGKGPVRR